MKNISFPERRINEFEEYVNKLNKKARKYGFPKVEYTVERKFRDYTTFFRNGIEKHFEEDYIDVSISEVEIKIGDYSLVGMIEIIGKDDNNKDVITFKKFSECPDFTEKYVLNQCDHCRVDRFRTKTFILFNGKQFKQVGSTCLNDYLGLTTALEYADYLSQVISIKEIFEKDLEGFFDINLVDLKGILFWTQYFVDVDGRFISRQEAREKLMETSSTSYKVKREINKHKITVPEKIEKEIERKVKDAIETVKNSIPESDFDKMLINFCQCEYIFKKEINMAVLIIKKYIDIVESQNKKESNWIGKIKDKFQGKVYLEKYFKYVSPYGEQFLYRFLYNGNVLVWRTKNMYLDKEKFYEITGTIKEYKEYKNEKQTYLTRCKINGNTQ